MNNKIKNNIKIEKHFEFRRRKKLTPINFNGPDNTIIGVNTLAICQTNTLPT